MAYAWFTFGLRCVYIVRKLPVSLFSYELRAEVETDVRTSDRYTGSQASTSLYKIIIHLLKARSP